MVGRVGRAGAVGQDQALVAAVVGLAHGGVHADVGGDAGQDQVGDAAGAQHQVEVGGVEGALARLVESTSPGTGATSGTISQPGSPRTRIRPARARPSRSRRRSGPSASACWPAGRTGPGRAPRGCGSTSMPVARACASMRRGGRQPGPGEPDVVAHPVDVAARPAEVDLPVDADQRDLRGVHGAVERPGVRGWRRPGRSPGPVRRDGCDGHAASLVINSCAAEQQAVLGEGRAEQGDADRAAVRAWCRPGRRRRPGRAGWRTACTGRARGCGPPARRRSRPG